LLPNQSKVEGSGGGDIARWTSPLKMFEYMAAGRPIVASDLPVLREVLDDEIAELVPPGDLDAMARAIQRLANDPTRRASMGAEAQRRAERYSWRGRVRLCLAGIEE
jgi:glycosyltransferase involved in cell wall biosynthesis